MYCSIKKNAILSLQLVLTIFIGLFVLVCFAQPVVPQVSIEIIDVDGVDHVKLSWEAVENAESYNIYVSRNPYLDDWEEPLTTVGEEVTEYITDSIDELGRAYFFYVTSYVISDWLVLVDGDLFNGIIHIDPFFIGKYEVMQSDFVDVMGDWYFYFEANPTHPAENVSWFDAVEYCNRLSIREGLTPVYSYLGRSNPDLWYVDYPGWNEDSNNHTNIFCNWEADGYRLPTEAEWQHAANGAAYAPESEWPYGSPCQYAGSDDVAEVAWYSDNAGRTTHPVETKAPNGLGIYDMSGNVFEWCWDIYGVNFPYGGNNPHGPDGGTDRVTRGGSWYRTAVFCTVSYRYSKLCATRRYNFLGFRVCRSTS